MRPLTPRRIPLQWLIHTIIHPQTFNISVGEIVVGELSGVDGIWFDMIYFETNEARRTILSATYALAMFKMQRI